METENIFRGILPILIFAFVAHRGYYVKMKAITHFHQTLEYQDLERTPLE